MKLGVFMKSTLFLYEVVLHPTTGEFQKIRLIDALTQKISEHLINHELMIFSLENDIQIKHDSDLQVLIYTTKTSNQSIGHTIKVFRTGSQINLLNYSDFCNDLKQSFLKKEN